MSADTRSNVHALIDQLPPLQLAAVQTLLQSMLDPLAKKLAAAELDDEPLTDDDRQAIAEAEEWSAQNKGIPLEEVLSDLGMAQVDWQEMANTPLNQPLSSRLKNG